jgi:hypothetical protein
MNVLSSSATSFSWWPLAFQFLSLQPALAGLLDQTRLSTIRLIILACLFQPSPGCPFRMMFLLIGDVLQHPSELLSAEADDAISALPLEHRSAGLLVDLMGARAFQILDQIADANQRFDIHCQMHMGARAVDAVKVNALGLAAAGANEIVD